MLKLNYYSEIRKYLIISLFFNNSDLGIESKDFCLQFLVDISTQGSGSMDPHASADSDPEGQHITNSTDTDPKHWISVLFHGKFMKLS